jgi:carboxyl-terminal processing protease
MNNRYKIILPLVFGVLIAAGIWIGKTIGAAGNAMGTNPSMLIYPQNNKLNTLINLISSEYVDTVNTSQIVEDVIPQLLDKLDPHSVYIPAKDLQQVNEELEGNFGGIGVQFSMQNDTVMVISVISGGPSAKLGILPGDRIIAVNDSSIAGIKISTDKVMKQLRGEMGTKVKVKILRGSQKIDFDIVRGMIPVYSVDVAYMVDQKTGYIKIDRFAQTTYDEMIMALAKLKSQGCTQVIMDFRGNSGGLLDAVIRMCNEFLSKNDLIVYTEGRSQPRQDVRANGAGSCQDVKLVVMIDEFSASASEIFAGAIQDNDRGVVVGRRSFGKGLVQQQIPLPDGSALRLTVARYHTPSGRCIQKPYTKGNKDYYEDIIHRYDQGEFFQKDSVKFDEAEKYTTKSGRTVFGGGGIMPDVFVARDTMAYSNYYFMLRSKGTVYSYALSYADKNREVLQKYKTAKELKQYLDSKPILDELVKKATQDGVVFNAREFERSKKMIDVEVKAYIARNIIDNEGFYPIIQEADNVFQTAVEEAAKL